MKQPKFKVGQRVYCQSDWFAGSYIPDFFVIQRIEMIGDIYYYYAKRKRIPVDERMLFATEEEAQLHEVERFIEIKKKELNFLASELQKVGLQEQVLLTDDRPTIDCSHKFQTGDVVYGHMNGGDFAYEPETFIIRKADVIYVDEVEQNIYYLKGHGTNYAFEEYLYPTYKEALLADCIRFKENFKGCLRGIESRAKALKIENKVNDKLLEWHDATFLIENK